MTEAIDLDELERRLREKWQPEVHQPVVDAEAMAVARKLMDRGNAARLARTTRGQRFHYHVPVRTAEYFFAPPTYGYGGYMISAGGWAVNIYVDGRKRTQTRDISDESCQRIVKALEQAGIHVKRIISERERQEDAAHIALPSKQVAPSRRHQILKELARFRA